jgi:8-oxo-dGTP pyrophosphatase MutT (NUDIX family)
MCSATRIDVIDHAGSGSPALPASTVVLVRDRTDGELGIEVFMIHRGAGTSFGGMWAFPGGAIEDGDIPPGTEPDPLPAARQAAVRETQEEVGLDVDADSLVFWSHWLPPSIAPKRFSTWFFLAPASALHADEHVGIDGDEVHAHRWLTPADALAAQARGEIQLAPPTFITLHDLVPHASVADAIAAADPEHFATTVVVGDGGVRYCLWAGDAAYESGDLTLAGPRHRIAMVEGPWNYDRSAGRAT